MTMEKILSGSILEQESQRHYMGSQFSQKRSLLGIMKTRSNANDADQIVKRASNMPVKREVIDNLVRTTPKGTRFKAMSMSGPKAKSQFRTNEQISEMFKDSYMESSESSQQHNM